jgi:hypothetical protein
MSLSEDWFAANLAIGEVDHLWAGFGLNRLSGKPDEGGTAGMESYGCLQCLACGEGGRNAWGETPRPQGLAVSKGGVGPLAG